MSNYITKDDFGSVRSLLCKYIVKNVWNLTGASILSSIVLSDPQEFNPEN